MEEKKALQPEELDEVSGGQVDHFFPIFDKADRPDRGGLEERKFRFGEARCSGRDKPYPPPGDID